MTTPSPQACVVLVTTGSETEAETIATALLEERLAACVNILSPVRSLYRWQGKNCGRPRVAAGDQNPGGTLCRSRGQGA